MKLEIISRLFFQWVKSVQNSVDEIGKVARVLAGDATDAVNTVRFLVAFNTIRSYFKSKPIILFRFSQIKLGYIWT